TFYAAISRLAFPTRRAVSKEQARRGNECGNASPSRLAEPTKDRGGNGAWRGAGCGAARIRRARANQGGSARRTRLAFGRSILAGPALRRAHALAQPRLLDPCDP